MSGKRLAIVDPDKCKPNKCNKECKRICPIESQGRQCIDIESIAKISEYACIGCNICTHETRGCPFGAISIINIPKDIGDFVVHRFNENGFRLYKLPILKKGSIMGIIGQNGIGKSTVIKIFCDKIRPNFEEFDKENTSKDIIKNFRGSEIQKYLTLLYDGKIKVSYKVQDVKTQLHIGKVRKITLSVKEYIISKGVIINDTTMKVLNDLELTHLLESIVTTLSGGEFQRLLCVICALQEADIYIFDEPTNFLDVKQRLRIANLITSLKKAEKYVCVIDHDLSYMDLISDYITIMFGEAGAFGVASLPHSTSEAINYYFDGFIRPENMRFRDNIYNFKELTMTDDDISKSELKIPYSAGEVEFPKFKLKINAGILPLSSSMTVILGENGTGKTTYLNYLKNKLDFTISYKPQYLEITEFIKSDGTYPTVRELFDTKIRAQYNNELFKSDVIKPLKINKILDRYIDELSGGELQKVWIIYCLGQDAQVYLIDEPSANLDIEQRFNITKIIKRFILHNKKSAFIVEHDLMLATSWARESNSRVIVFECENKDNMRISTACEPMEFKEGINKFLKILNITFRTESTYAKHDRPRINKLDSTKDREQKSNGNYYC